MTTDARALDWDEVTARLAAAAESPAGRALCVALPFADNPGESRRRMAAVAELARLLRAGETLPSLAAPEIDAALAAAEKLVALGAEELRPVALLARVAEAARRYFLSGTLKGFPSPPAMVRGEQSSPAPHAISTSRGPAPPARNVPPSCRGSGGRSRRWAGRSSWAATATRPARWASCSTSSRRSSGP